MYSYQLKNERASNAVAYAAAAVIAAAFLPGDKCVHIHYTVKEQNIDFILLCISETAARIPIHTRIRKHTFQAMPSSTATHIVSKMLSRKKTQQGEGSYEKKSTRAIHVQYRLCVCAL